LHGYCPRHFLDRRRHHPRRSTRTPL
jgi:hypothetical protein